MGTERHFSFHHSTKHVPSLISPLAKRSQMPIRVMALLFYHFLCTNAACVLKLSLTTENIGKKGIERLSIGKVREHKSINTATAREREKFSDKLEKYKKRSVASSGK